MAAVPSGYASYDDDVFYPSRSVYRVNRAKSVTPYGRFGQSANELVADGPQAAGAFEVYREGPLLRAHNHGVATEPYTIGRVNARGNIQVREMNRHPDGEQLFYSAGTPFWMLVAPPSDTLNLRDVVLLFCDGSRPLYIHRNTWHQPPYVLGPTATLQTAQAASHMCVTHDFIDTNQCWLELDFTSPP